jgi:L-threonylcarbamoyladenylate synthase
MKNIYLNIFRFNNNSISKAINVLRKNSIVGLPTETVYGLAGNAYSKKSINKIYSTKGRPKKNPLIVHYLNINNAKEDVKFNKDFFILYKKFCPGPITFILKKKSNSRIQPKVTSGLKTVAIRFPKHKVMKTILKKLNFPLAIPSANQSSGISPVTAIDVAEEFAEKIKIIVDGGKSKIGIESTVIDLTGKLKILRPGAISASEISKILKKKVKIITRSKLIKAPGMLKKHYSPNIPMKLNQKNSPKNHAFIVFGKEFKKNKNIFNLSKKSSLNEAASNLYKIFRKIKKLKYKKINVVRIPNKDIGIAINDRLKHAAEIK